MSTAENSPVTKKIKLDHDEILKDERVCNPISDLESALKYKDAPITSKKFHSFIKNSFVVPNALGECHQELRNLSLKQRIDRHTAPKTLVCHDMKGGYLEDKFVNGCDKGNGYTFYRWSEIDIFIYFSHHFLTIPPPGWVNAAHNNNVKILGTMITEGNSGKKICAEIFKSDDNWRDFAKALVNICILNSFDGWLLNIENVIEDTKPLINFISYLTTEMRKVNHEFVILWYDSVIQDGTLKWQDELNDLNKCYFDVCDGIFLNYSWKEQNLQNSVAKAQHRILDVFVGVDVFGRNCHGGFQSHLSAELIRKYGLSVAIFAPGWTHETLKTEEEDKFFDLYCKRDNGFWLNLHPYFYTHPIIKPFVTTFNLGANEKTYNLNKQELVLTRPTHCGMSSDLKNEIIEKCDCIQLCSEGCYPDTVSYLLTTSNLDKEKEYVHKLFTCSIDAVKNIAVSCIVKKAGPSSSDLNVILLSRDAVGRRYIYRLTADQAQNSNSDTHVINPRVRADATMNAIKQSVDFGKIRDGWTVRYYFISIPCHMKIMEIGALITGDSVLLGGFAVKTNINL